MGKRPGGPIVPPPAKVTSRKHARRLTTQYHSITHRLAAASTESERESCRAELDSMGGVAAYQAASALNTALNPVSRWVKKSLLNSSSVRQKSTTPLRVLEIGAVNTQLLDSAGLAVRAIDLHTVEPRIEQCDFFTLPHGGEVDAAGGCPKPYDAIVCSMVLNCVPHARKRFDMLVGIRSMLKSGGKAFITLPRSCIDHSYTLCEASFCDALAAVGLRRLNGMEGGKDGTGGAKFADDVVVATEAPVSTKIVYFECVAELPCADAALRVQRARHEARLKSRVQASGSVRAKSAGATFDVDVGGTLGFGVRVARSYAPAETGRIAKEQALVRSEFLRKYQESTPSRGGPTTCSSVRNDAALAASAEHGDGEHDNAEVHSTVTSGLEAAAIERQLTRVARGVASGPHLDYSQWRWAPSDANGHDSPRWRLGSDEADALADSAQVGSGWQWSPSGWVQSAPSNSQQRSLIPTSSSGALGRGQVKRRAVDARVWSVGACWWRRVLL